MNIYHQIIPVVMLCAFTMVSLAETARLPLAGIDSTSWDFGTVRQGEKVNKTFILRNDGQSTLLIEGAKFSMRGMNIFVKQKIAPGESVDIQLSWDTSGFVQDAEGQALLLLNDPKHPEMVLTLSGTVIAPIQILPRPAFHMSQFQGEQKSRIITIRNNQEQDVNITKIEPHGDHFIATLDTVEKGKLYNLKVTVPSSTEAGRFRESVFVYTDDPVRKRIHIEVNVLVKSDIHLAPDLIDFGKISISKIKKTAGVLDFLQQIIIITRRTGKMTIESMESDIPFLNLDLDPSSSAAQAFRLDAGLIPKKLKQGTFTGSVTLKTDDPKFPEIKIPVNATISD